MGGSVYATPANESALTEGVDRTVFYESVPAISDDPVLTTTDGSTLSQTRRVDAYGVLARSGEVVMVGDTSIFSQEFLCRADNEQLVGTLLEFLVSGEKLPENAPEPPEDEEPETERPRPSMADEGSG